MNKDKIIGIVLIALGIFIVIIASQISSLNLKNDVGPSLFPLISGFGLIICGVGLVINKSTMENNHYLTSKGWKRLFIMSGIILLYAIVLVLFGFVISTPIAIFISILVMNETNRSYKTAFIISICMTASVFVIFEKILHVMLPAGKLF